MLRLRTAVRLIDFALSFRGLKSSANMSGPVETLIRMKISSKLSPEHFDVINESHMHNVPSGAESHFKVIVVSSAFENKPLIQRHRMVNDLLREEFENGLHALSIVAKTPSQWAESNKKLFHSEAMMNLKLTADGISEISEEIGDNPKSPFIVQRIQNMFNKSEGFSTNMKNVSTEYGSKSLLDSKLVHILESVPVEQDLVAKLPIVTERELNLYEVDTLPDIKNAEDDSEKKIIDNVDCCSNVRVMKAVLPNLKSDEKENNLHTEESDESIDSPEASEIKDGHYFLKLLDKRIKILDCIASYCESNVSVCSVEESKGELRSVAGKAKLLKSEKFNQFRGLCHKNISGSDLDGYPTTSQDLEGFWDMISIQFDDIITKYEIAKTMKDNDWKFPSQTPSMKSTKPLMKDGPKRALTPLRSIQPIKPQPSRNKPTSSALRQQVELMKAREITRKKLIEERRLAMKQLSSSTND